MTRGGDKVERALDAISAEYGRASSKFPAFNSAHEGYAVLAEETDELWNEVITKHRDRDRMTKEAIQVGAMALRFIIDVCYREEAP